MFCGKAAFQKILPEKVFREIEEIRSFGYTCLWTADDCFTLDSEDFTAFCREMIRHGVPVGWTCLSRSDRLTPGLVDFMKRAGRIWVYLILARCCFLWTLC